MLNNWKIFTKRKTFKERKRKLISSMHGSKRYGEKESIIREKENQTLKIHL